MTLTAEQILIIGHNPVRNGRVLAGPGTGKSTACVALLDKLQSENPALKIGLLTFTRAATQELAKKISKNSGLITQPSTIHSFSLSLILQNKALTSLPNPIRIPDTWELEKLIRGDLARLLRKRGFSKITVDKIKEFDRELSSRWQSLDPNMILLAQIDPQLRNAYIGQWESHRKTYGYSLLSELPLQAGNLIEDFDVGKDLFDLLIIDEYQDLNEADIRFIRLLNKNGTKVIAIGDDDQSIYSFRMAAPIGILRFDKEFGNCEDYKLTVSLRCGKEIIDAATMIIEQATGRPHKASLSYNPGSQTGKFLYLKYKNEKEEIKGVANLIHQRISKGIPPREIVVLVRSQVDTWANMLIPEITKLGITAMSPEGVKSILIEPKIRIAIAKSHLAINKFDSLAWWTLLHFQTGVSLGFCEFIYNSAEIKNQTFGQTLVDLYPNFVGAPSTASANVVSKMMGLVFADISKMNIDWTSIVENNWGEWLVNVVGRSNIDTEMINIIENVGKNIAKDKGLYYFLGNIEPVAQDLAIQSDSIKIMSMTASKGITVNTCIIMGVEEGIIPHPRGNLDEERRLLYVGITRATDLSIFTFAHRRNGPTARHGTKNVNQPRGRCPLMALVPIGNYENGENFILPI